MIGARISEVKTPEEYKSAIFFMTEKGIDELSLCSRDNLAIVSLFCVFKASAKFLINSLVLTPNVKLRNAMNS